MPREFQAVGVRASGLKVSSLVHHALVVRRIVVGLVLLFVLFSSKAPSKKHKMLQSSRGTPPPQKNKTRNEPLITHVQS